VTTAVVVTYRSAPWIRSCLTALDGIPTVVIDNAGPDETAAIVAQEFPTSRLIVRSRNEGFAVAVNEALAGIEDDVLVVNPDVTVNQASVARLQTYLDQHPNVGLVVPLLRYPDGRLQESVRTFPNPLALLARRSPFGRTRLGHRILSHFLLDEAQLGEARPIEWAIGAAILVRRQAIREIGGMDERIFLYGEDLDWCIRMWEGGWQVHVEPAATFTHAFTRLSRRSLDLRSAPVRHHWASLVKLFTKYPGLLLGRGPRAARQAAVAWSAQVSSRRG
jgi:N-acetylglucosaminyl-diphospho-decaprenol L-rhamnosyltransferase